MNAPRQPLGFDVDLRAECRAAYREGRSLDEDGVRPIALAAGAYLWEWQDEALREYQTELENGNPWHTPKGLPGWVRTGLERLVALVDAELANATTDEQRDELAERFPYLVDPFHRAEAMRDPPFPVVRAALRVAHSLYSRMSHGPELTGDEVGAFVKPLRDAWRRNPAIDPKSVPRDDHAVLGLAATTFTTLGRKAARKRGSPPRRHYEFFIDGLRSIFRGAGLTPPTPKELAALWCYHASTDDDLDAARERWQKLVTEYNRRRKKDQADETAFGMFIAANREAIIALAGR